MEPALAVLRRRAGTIAEAIVARAPAGAVAHIFAGGSLARGGVWAATIDGILEIYSDIDLYVVVDAPALRGAVRAAAAAVLHAAGEVPGVRFLRGVDAGVYTRADLRAQPLRPGTADLATRHIVLHGSAPLPGDLLPGAGGAMPAAEALYLLENRSWDTRDGAEPGTPAARLECVRALKTDLDVAAAYMIVAGCDPCAVADPAASLGAGELPGVPPDVRAAALRALAAREDPGAFLAGAPVGGGALATVCRAWLDLAPRVLDAPGAAPGDLLARRCNAGHRMDNAREFVRVAGCAGIGRVRALGGALRCSARSPRTTLRVHAIAQALAGVEWDAHAAHAARVTAALGFGAGTLDERVRRAQRALA